MHAEIPKSGFNCSKTNSFNGKPQATARFRRRRIRRLRLAVKQQFVIQPSSFIRHSSFVLRHLLRLLLFAALFAPGCAGYRIGACSLYPPDVRTIHVPVFENDTFRRGLGERLTEAVVKEIELKTPLKVVSAANADSVLYGRLVDMQKRVLIENRNDEPRDIETAFRVDINWVDRRGNAVAQRTSLPLSSALLTVSQTADFVPEAGQSIATAQQEAIQRLAEQIVSQMEARW
jgi:hypothetical protein